MESGKSGMSFKSSLLARVGGVGRSSMRNEKKGGGKREEERGDTSIFD